MDKWRENFHGVQVYHEPTNFLVFGAIDDLWVNSRGEYIVVDYKATAKANPVTKLEATRWHDAYRRQMEIYQWLLRQNGLKVSDIGYFVYCTGKMDREAFDKRIDFDVNLIEYKGDDSWIEKTLFEINKCLGRNVIPRSSESCDHCSYWNSRRKFEK